SRARLAPSCRHHAMKMRVYLFSITATLAVLVSCTSNSGSSSTAPCVRDADEPNDTLQTTAFIGEIQDDPPPQSQLTKEVQRDVSLDTPADVDWFRATVHDTGIGSNPIVSVTVGSGMEATVWFECASGKVVSTVCQLGNDVTNDSDITSKGCGTIESNGTPAQLTMTTDCANTDTDTDDGDAIVRVRRTTATQACVSYTVSISAD
ncbi:MAG: hypothetical protein ABI461_19455, partial [Polyangiaceae bacterium]